ncbi:phosphotransferase enzyme family protein [Alloiococcus sp. CFN-8]|uniref:phosphotransferase enzyme family protein n=1 Tax=Alloiococcus sp. CFN-8 TaxID=3416081 RepID=UPI003CFB870C
MILKNWEYDCDDLNLLKYFRISSNAVYWCKNQGTTFFLRFSPAEEKTKEGILAELEFLSYLRNNGYPAVETIPSKSGKELEVVNTPWGTFYAVAFKSAPGKQVTKLPLTKDIIFGLGSALGKLHKLSSTFNPIGDKRRDWKEIMDWIENVLLTYPEETLAKGELSMIRCYFSKLSATKENFGLIHFDFEVDNVFYNEATKTYTPIDFDDLMYHWYALDIVQSLDSIEEYLPEKELDASINHFIQGYRSEYAISDEMIKLFPIFKRYSDLYGYVRFLHTTEEKWDNEPDWMIDLRIKLKGLLDKRRNVFTMPIDL